MNMTKHWIIEGDSKEVLKKIKDNSIHLAVTSPPYFNAREYSQWETLEDYLKDMKAVFEQVFRILNNHRVFVLNVGDVQCRMGKQPWTQRRVPLGALFTVMCQEIGFEFVDDYIWDKGEPQSYRHVNGGNNYPFYIYPINVYEHILIFHKHVRDMTRITCPVCGTSKVQNNSQSEINVQSWECNNENCDHRSPGNRGKRYSARSIMMDLGKTKENAVEKHFLQKWRRDIVKFSPVIKWFNGKNILGHSAPFPEDIPDIAIKFYTYKGDTVLDPFAGSFTTSLSAKKLGRNSIGVDINKEFIELGKKRLGINSKQMTLSNEKPEFIILNKRQLQKIDFLDIPESKVWNKERYLRESKKRYEEHLKRKKKS
jgi:DNA modification methylase